MNEVELEELERGMRALILDLGLSWVLANIDDGIAAGLQREMTLPRGFKWQERTMRLDEPDLFDIFDKDSSPGGGQTLVGNVRLTPEERVLLIIGALNRLAVELPEIQTQTRTRLADAEEPYEIIEDIQFLPDEDDAASPSGPYTDSPAAHQAREAARQFFLTLQAEVRDDRRG